MCGIKKICYGAFESRTGHDVPSAFGQVYHRRGVIIDSVHKGPELARVAVARSSIRNIPLVA